jgi:hypothetical protein
MEFIRPQIVRVMAHVLLQGGFWRAGPAHGLCATATALAWKGGNGPRLLRIWRMHCKIRLARTGDDACATRVRYA